MNGIRSVFGLYSAEVVRLVCTCPSGCRRQFGIGEHLPRLCVGALAAAAALVATEVLLLHHVGGRQLWSQPGPRQGQRLRVEIRVKSAHSHRSFVYQSAASLRAHPLLVQVTVRNEFAVPHSLLIYSALHRIDCFLDVLVVWIKQRGCGGGHDSPHRHRWLLTRHGAPTLTARPRFFRGS